MLTFKNFDKLINGNGSKLYLPLHNKKPIDVSDVKTYKEIYDLSTKDPQLEIGLIIPMGLMVINIDDRDHADLVLSIIKNRNEKVLAVETPKGMHVYVKSGEATNTRNNLIALGIPVGTLTQDIGKTYVVTPFKHPGVNKNPRMNKMKIVHYNGIDKVPHWLTPMYISDHNKPRKTPIELPIDNSVRLDVYKEHINNLKFTRLNSNERVSVLELINNYIARTPLGAKELEAFMLENNDDTLPANAFYDQANNFLHYKMGDYIIEYTNAKKDERSGKLYFYNDRKKVYDYNNTYLKGIITKLVPHLKDFQKNEVIKHMEARLSLNTVLFDTDPYLINFKNGILDLETLTLYPHTPDIYSTVTLNVDYNPNAHANVADKFFSDATCGDKDIEQLLYEALGYCFMKTVELEKAFLLVGEGRNGKTTYLDIIKNIVGVENSTTVDFKELANSFGTGGLDGKLVSLAGDISNQRMSESDTFKKIVSGDQIRINEKYEKKYDAVVFTKLFFSANDIPKSADTTFGFYRKLCIIPFNADLRGVKQQEGAFFKRKLMKRESLEYIAFKAVQAIHNLITNTGGFIEPQAVVKQMRDYKISNSSVLAWFYQSSYKDDILIGYGVNMHGSYTMWCERNYYNPKAFGNFIKDLEHETGYKFDIQQDKFTM